MKTINKKNSNLKLLIAGIMGFILLSGSVLAQKAQRKINDENIKLVVKSELISHREITGFNIDVKSTEGIVTLEGNSDNLLEKELAGNYTKSIKGVRGVINLIEVNPKVIPDTEIEKNINTALLKNAATESFEIDVTAVNGLVTLAGQVDSWQEKKLAENVAKSIIGVRGVSNHLIFTHQNKRSDQEILADIKEALKWDVRVDDALIDVEVIQGNVKLSGVVGSVPEKEWAELISWINGVQQVDASSLEVDKWFDRKALREGKFANASDEAIKKAIEDAFVYDPRVNSFDPGVVVENGKVFLQGSVPSIRAKIAAQETAQNIVGVWSVKNYLKVRPGTIPENLALISDVRDMFALDPFLRDEAIEVKVNSGIVTLTGNTSTEYLKFRASEKVYDIKGVVTVKNKIQVGEEPNESLSSNNSNTLDQKTLINDIEIKEQIEDQLWWSPFVNQDEVQVEVFNGKATLKGVVDSQREKTYAAINALEGGATTVINQLEVEKTNN
ncbi:BON domain-containing protein [Flexithrix dorotheae]|uniref:BON domain-containing protein n=1 Tax=Flexithrix dorotheae TaxID=70993 RepID=UPI0003745A9F|nr:BON domain-containing protein [Flexithrix dorotheae]